MKSVYFIFVSLFTCIFGSSIFTLDTPDGSPIPGNTPLEQCEISENHILDIQSLIMEPQPPKIGGNLVISATGLILDTIEEGAYIEVTVKLGLIQILKKNFDLCDLLYENKDDLGLECPVAPGVYKLMKEVEIPPEAPAGKYIVLVRAFNGKDDDNKIGCVTGEITLSR